MIATFDTENENAFRELDVEIVSTIADQAAIALVNPRLYESNVTLAAERNASAQLAVLGTAFAALQHRINNTFNIINPNIGRLRARIDVSDAEIAKILDIIERNAKYTSEIIARIQEPLKHTTRSTINVNSTLDDLCRIVRAECADREGGANLEIIVELDDSIPLIQAPLGQISEVFRNLMENGCKAMNYSGKLNVTSRQSNGNIEVRVMDTGSGIPPALQRRLFKRPAPSKEPGAGSGLGLWLSSLMLMPIGGKIFIDKTDNSGTTMLVEIPAGSRGK